MTRACDAVLDKFSSQYPIVAIPWLHVLSAHPNSLRKYRHALRPRNFFSAFPVVLHNIAYQLYKLCRSLVERPIHEPQASVADIIFISHLVHAGSSGQDFYYGSLPIDLQQTKGLRIVIGLIDHTPGYKTKKQLTAIESGVISKILFPRTLPLQKECHLVLLCFASFRVLWNAYRKEKDPDIRSVLREAAFQSFAPETFKELRIYDSIRTLVNTGNPAALISTWEGWAWERLAVYAARKFSASTRCLGYQHTILYPSSHSVKKSMGTSYDPDVIFTIGDLCADILKEQGQFTNTAIVSYGSQRLARSPREQFNKTALATCLVAPEGIESECLLLFHFAIELARKNKEMQFIFRTHPVLPFSMLAEKYHEFGSLPENCKVSQEPGIDSDFDRSNFLLYRGSSVALYAVLNGLRPIYYSIPGEISIDPLYLLSHWHISVTGSDDFGTAVLADAAITAEEKQKQYSAALSFCKTYASAPDTELIYRLIKAGDPFTT